ncbi:MAG TPA: gliding motility-associated C-terminal domain-containing protein [Salinimicrobium sp.]|nr:gliding motility-associated C-terminal domain-containing protein [Salinimicrobium sp.]
MWKYFLVFLFFGFSSTFAQNIELYTQFNGRYDYTAIGNSMNTVENGTTAPCVINTSSSATLVLEDTQTVVAAYLYWAGSGTGDFDIELNGTPISAERTFSVVINSGLTDFAAFADVTAQVTATGTGIYEVSELDISEDIAPYCPTGSNFAGWAIAIIFEDPNLPLNQLNVYDGLQSVPTSLNIQLNNLNVLDNEGAKIGFIAWEGDASIAVNESLRINGNLIGNPPLNPSNNAFNGTNSFNGGTLFNMDIDFYNIQNNISIGDTSAEIQLTSGQDVVLINNIITVLNSQLPDASVLMDEVIANCGNGEVTIDFTISNNNSTEILPAGTEFQILANSVLVETGSIPQDLDINESWQGTMTLNLDPSIINYDIEILVDPGNLIPEFVEDNNAASIFLEFENFPDLPIFPDLENCLEETDNDLFNLTQQIALIPGADATNVQFFTSQEDAENNTNPIPYPENYTSPSSPQTIWLRYGNEFCYKIGDFNLERISCTFPDASPEISNIQGECYDREIQIDFMVSNNESTAALASGTEILFFADGIIIGSVFTPTEIPMNESWESSSSFSLPENLVGDIEIYMIVDPDNLVNEIFEDNNEAFVFYEMKNLGPLVELEPLLTCNEGEKIGTFNLTAQEFVQNQSNSTEISFFASYEDAIADFNEILETSAYLSQPTPQPIFVRYEELGECYNIGSFFLETENCPPFVPQGFSPNADGVNDTFEISGLYDIFENFEISIFTRLGNKIYEGNNKIEEWNGTCNTGLSSSGDLPTGTYYYVLNLNDPGYDIITGWVYLNR